MKTLLNSKTFARGLIAVGLLVLSLVALQSVAAQGVITYPIAELGNCADKAECRAYCDVDGPFSDDLSEAEKASRRKACNDFASRNRLTRPSHNLEKFNVVKEDGGPDGKCGSAADPIAACKAVCDVSSNMIACVAYAKKHNLFEGKELEEAEKVLKALERGAKLPAGCKNAETCKSTCEDPADLATAKQCFAFAKEAGLLPPEFDQEKSEKFFQAVENGTAPLSFRDMRKCENPETDEILAKCVEFGAQMGLISPQEAELVRKTGGKGPGGCRGKQCQAYCESEEHQDECVRFSEEHNLISPEEKARMQEGIEQFKTGLNEAPAEVKECLKTTLGEDVINQIIAGTKRPSRDLGDKMRTCFDSYFSTHRPKPGEPFGSPPQGEDFPTRFPPEVEGCLESKLGPEAAMKLSDPRTGRPSADMERLIGECMSSLRGEGAQGGGEAGTSSTERREFNRPYPMPPQGEQGQNYQYGPYKSGERPEGYQPTPEEMQRFREGYQPSPEEMQRHREQFNQSEQPPPPTPYNRTNLPSGSSGEPTVGTYERPSYQPMPPTDGTYRPPYQEGSGTYGTPPPSSSSDHDYGAYSTPPPSGSGEYQSGSYTTPPPSDPGSAPPPPLPPPPSGSGDSTTSSSPTVLFLINSVLANVIWFMLGM